MNPPTISLVSTKGPSVTPNAATIFPPGLSLPPISRMFALNFSFQALKTAYISCICAGEGCCCFPGGLRWMNRHFCVAIMVSCGPCVCRLVGALRRAKAGRLDSSGRFFASVPERRDVLLQPRAGVLERQGAQETSDVL